ncbi:MAG: hypothetical protein ACM3NF_09735 [Gemmatimonadota bacterium]
MSSNCSRDGAAPGRASARARSVLRTALSAALLLCLLSVPHAADAAATLPEMARLEGADRLEKSQVDRLARWWGALGFAREAAEFVERRVRAGDLSPDEAAPIFGKVVRAAGRRGDGEALRAACDAAIRNGIVAPAVLDACAERLRLEGRLDAAAALLSRIGPGEAQFRRARYAMGQIAVARGDLEGALAVFRDLKESPDGRNDVVAARAALAEDDLLLVAGRPAERSTASPAPSGGSSRRDAVVEAMRAGDAALAGGRTEEAVRAYRRAVDGAKAMLAAPLPSGAGTARAMEGFPAAFRLLLAAHEAAEKAIARNAAVNALPYSADVGTLLADLLCLDFVLENADGALPAPAGPFSLPPARRDALFRLIEKNVLGGMDIAGVLAKTAGDVDVFENLAHPIRRYRNLAGLEARQAAMQALAGRAAKSRRALVASLETAGRGELRPVLRDLDAYLRDLDAIRAARDEAREVIRREFDIFPEERRRDADDGAAVAAAREGLTFDGERTAELRRAGRDLERRARSLAREREAGDVGGLHAAAARRYAEALVEQARFLDANRPQDWESRFRRALDDAVGVLQGDVLDPGTRSALAIRIGSLVVGRLPRWERFPETVAGQPEGALIRNVLRMIDRRTGEDGRDGDVLAVLALLRWRIGDGGAAAAAREFLAGHPASPMAGPLALRLGHGELRARRWREAEEAYRAAAGRGPAEVTAAARAMLGWLAYRDGDPVRALRELSVPLSEPLASRPDAGAFLDDVIALAVRCGAGMPVEGVAAYGPVRARTRAGKRIMAGVAGAAARRGRMERAADLYSTIAVLYAGDGDGPAYEIRAIDSLVRGGRERDALSRALRVARSGRERPGADGRDRELPLAEKKALGRLLREIAERRFAEGVRSGGADPMSDAAAAIAGYFDLAAGGAPADDARLRLKWAVASLGCGDRAGALRLLEGILSGGGSGEVEERAAFLHSDAVIAGFRRGDIPAPRVEASLRVLFGRFPGGKATAVGMRAANALLEAGDPAGAARAADAVERGGFVPPGIRNEARLVHARALIASGDFPGARAKADEVLAAPSGAGEAGVRTHARDVLFLAARKEAQDKAASGDRIAAGALLEGLAARFPELPEAGDRLLDALTHYRDGSDPEAAIRAGSAFLRGFPGRAESLDVAATVGPLLEERGRGGEAAALYARMAGRFPRDGRASRLLFRAARLAEEGGDREEAERWYAAYAKRPGEPRGAGAYAMLSAGLLAWERDRSLRAIEAIGKALRLVESAAGDGAPPELPERAGKARIAVGEYWADRFRDIALVAPLDRSLSRKQRCFRKSLAAYEEAGRAGSPEVRVQASGASGDLFVEFGRAILSSQRPKGMDAAERELYENALARRSRQYLERALEGYAGALDRLRRDGVPASVSEPLLRRVEATSRLLTMAPEARAR